MASLKETSPSKNPTRRTNKSNKIQKPIKLNTTASLKSNAFKSDLITLLEDSIEAGLRDLANRYGVVFTTKEELMSIIKKHSRDYFTGDLTSTCVLLGEKFVGRHGNDCITKVDKNFKLTFGKCLPMVTEYLPRFIDNTGKHHYITPEAIIQALTDGVELMEYPSIGCLGPNTMPKDYIEYRDYNKFENKVNIQNLTEKTTAYKYGLISPSYRSTYSLKYTFGVEIECSKSYVPHNISRVFNMSCVRDGSLNGQKGGPEYVTGVLVGDAGVMHLQRITNYLSERSTIDRYCGIHTHIGGFKPTKEFALSIFILAYKLQDEIFAMLPPTRKENEYCRLIPGGIIKKLKAKLKINGQKYEKTAALEDSHDLLVEYVGALDLLGGKDKYLSSKGLPKDTILGKFLNKRNTHPMGRKANYNHKTPRYEWINLVPLLFNEKGPDVYTVEFRPHSASLNFLKIKNWLVLCMLIVKYAEDNAQTILYSDEPITLEKVVTTVLPSKLSSDVMLSYIKERKDKFSKLEQSGVELESTEYKEESFSRQSDKSIKELCA